ncbi:MAG TPA: glycoside hydrolase family 99-like domain-containing protein [Candidatus Fimimorpha faecalis]|uniref:Glycoside hydrolase family 99-like domain-containing protein n=1 Tax=Candidatus Fimimorpha faecalis TaxID=2840824 RepID=A0A9D1EG97_9FIRM|nr:glycoside hydrolase family 99-like domain-containing protein [Candidatus Fimimorpha faecalis]
MNKKRARVIAFYLPQFHPTEENDKYWGKGFTEWTNVAKAKPLFKGHYQPQIPADLGFYDLRLSEVREAQAEMARECGVEGFCYWHYWFGDGKRTLDRPFNEVLESGKPDYPFCLGWANHSWTNKTWIKNKAFQQDTTIFEQTYPGEKDYIAHFYAVLPAFKDHRYITVDEKPLFLIFNPDDIPDGKGFIELWQKLAKENGLKGIFFVGHESATGRFNLKQFDYLSHVEERYNSTLATGYDAICSDTTRYAELKTEGTFRKLVKAGIAKYLGFEFLYKYDYEKLMSNFYIPIERKENVFPEIVPRFDRSPRAGKGARIYVNSTPEKFGDAVDKALDQVKDKQDEHKIIFLKSWNEWGEGNYMEPDLKFGHGYLNELKKRLSNH